MTITYYFSRHRNLNWLSKDPTLTPLKLPATDQASSRGSSVSLPNTIKSVMMESRHTLRHWEEWRISKSSSHAVRYFRIILNLTQEVIKMALSTFWFSDSVTQRRQILKGGRLKSICLTYSIMLVLQALTQLHIFILLLENSIKGLFQVSENFMATLIQIDSLALSL